MSEHVVQLNRYQKVKLREWLKENGSGSCTLGPRCTVEAVENGGLLIRTKQDDD